MAARPRTILGAVLILFGVALLGFWEYLFSVLAIVGGFLVLFWRRAPRALW